MLDEKGTASALKKAWRGSGYTVVFLDGMVMVRSSCWGFRILEQHCPPKVLGMIVEHIGSLPEHEAYKCRKDNEAQTVMLDEEITFWNDALNRAENAADPIRRTSLTMDGYEIWQETAQLKVLPFDPDYIRIIDREHIRQGQVIRDESGNTDRRAYWEEFAGQMVVVAGIKYPDAGGLERLNGYPWLGENPEKRPGTAATVPGVRISRYTHLSRASIVARFERYARGICEDGGCFYDR